MTNISRKTLNKDYHSVASVKSVRSMKDPTGSFTTQKTRRQSMRKPRGVNFNAKYKKIPHLISYKVVPYIVYLLKVTSKDHHVFVNRHLAELINKFAHFIY